MSRDTRTDIEWICYELSRIADALETIAKDSERSSYVEPPHEPFIPYKDRVIADLKRQIAEATP